MWGFWVFGEGRSLGIYRTGGIHSSVDNERYVYRLRQGENLITMTNKEEIYNDSRFRGLEPFSSRIFLATPMHGEEEKYIHDAIRSGWVTTVGENIEKLESAVA